MTDPEILHDPQFLRAALRRFLDRIAFDRRRWNSGRNIAIHDATVERDRQWRRRFAKLKAQNTRWSSEQCARVVHEEQRREYGLAGGTGFTLDTVRRVLKLR